MFLIRVCRKPLSFWGGVNMLLKYLMVPVDLRLAVGWQKDHSLWIMTGPTRSKDEIFFA